MNREDFEFTKKILEFREKGVKEACLIVKEYLSNLEDPTKSAVTKEECIEAIKILVNYSFSTSNKNTMVEEFYCKEDCRYKNCFGFCPGEFTLDEESKVLCKEYRNPNYN